MSPLTLFLLVLGIIADDAHDSLALDHLAFITNALDASPDFHSQFLHAIRIDFVPHLAMLGLAVRVRIS